MPIKLQGFKNFSNCYNMHPMNMYICIYNCLVYKITFCVFIYIAKCILCVMHSIYVHSLYGTFQFS